MRARERFEAAQGAAFGVCGVIGEDGVAGCRTRGGHPGRSRSWRWVLGPETVRTLLAKTQPKSRSGGWVSATCRWRRCAEASSGLLLQEAGEEFRPPATSSCTPSAVLKRPAGDSYRRRHRGVGKIEPRVGARLPFWGLPRIVFDRTPIRQALRSLISPELSPELHTSSFYGVGAPKLPSRPRQPKTQNVKRVRARLSAAGAAADRAAAKPLSTASVCRGEFGRRDGRCFHLVPGFHVAFGARGARTVRRAYLKCR